jgi:hypothetical protein
MLDQAAINGGFKLNAGFLVCVHPTSLLDD